MVVEREDSRRPPLTPSDNRNAPVPASRRPRMKEVTSRYLSTPSPSTSYASSTPSTRRFPSPTVTARSAPTPQSQVRRSSSVDRSRPSNTSISSTSTSTRGTSTNTTTTTTTRSLSVSFQGESFSFQTIRAKPTPGRRSVDNYNRPWPAAVRSLDYSTGQRPGVEDRATNGEVSGSSDTDSVSSGSNSGSHEFAIPSRSRLTSRGICIPARFLQENHGRPRPIRQPSPSKIPNSTSTSTPNRAMASPIRGRQLQSVSQPHTPQPVNAPSILSFAMEVRRAKKGEYRIEEAHFLRLLDNRQLQLRWVNAKVNAAMSVQKIIAEKKLYNAWRCIAELRESVALKRMKLQVLKQNLKLGSILDKQVVYLEKWHETEREHSNSLFGISEALKASTLRLPLVGGAKGDVEELKEVTSSAMEVTNAIQSSMTSTSLLSKVCKTSLSVSELARVMSQEQILLAQSKDLLSTVTALHVKQCSLQGQVLQLKSKAS